MDTSKNDLSSSASSAASADVAVLSGSLVVSSHVVSSEAGSDYVDINVIKDNPVGNDVREPVPLDKKPDGPPPIICPHVNCPEKIIVCLDLNEEMHTTVFRSRAGDKYSGLELAKRAIKMFLLHKHQINPKHEFAFLVFHAESTMIHPFTNNPHEILKTLEETEMSSQQSGPLDLTHLFQTINDIVTLPEVEGDPAVMPPSFVVRLLLVFGRSHSAPTGHGSQVQKHLEASPHFFTDVLYIHEPPGNDNKCEEIFQRLCDLDHSGLSYIFEECKYTPILNSGAKLLAHPLQRPQQLQASYKIGTGPLSQQAKEEKAI